MPTTKSNKQAHSGEPAPAATAPRLLLYGIDTLQCCYYLVPNGSSGIDFEALGVIREQLRDARNQDPQPITLGSMEFLLAAHGSASGYPFVLNNPDYRVELGEFNNPSFHVTFRSEALWREPAASLNERFLAWAQSVGYVPAKPETLSRVDFCFDYDLPEVDFDENAFVSLASKDSQHRENGQIQTFTFGRDGVVLRVYDKIAEIEQQSHKTWFFELWGQEEGVWRIEWQVRKEMLRRFGIRTFGDLYDQSGDLLRYLASEHDVLKVPTKDRNRSRWPVHPLWEDLKRKIAEFNAQGVYRSMDPRAALEERIMRIGISLYGYQKQIAALRCVQRGNPFMSAEEARRESETLLRQCHDPLDWKIGVGKRIKLIQLGQ